MRQAPPKSPAFFSEQALTRRARESGSAAGGLGFAAAASAFQAVELLAELLEADVALTVGGRMG